MAYLKYTPVVGKGLLLKKQAVGDIGGLKVVSPFLAEDFMLGKFFQKKGFKTVLTAHGVCENVGHQTLRSVYQRHLRWGLIRKTSGFAAFILEPITYPLFSSLVGAYVLQQLFGFNFFLIFFINIFCFLTLDMIQFKMFSKRVYFFTPIAWLLKEVMALVLWFDILKSKSIYWRDKKFFLSKNSRLVFD
jgi:cellulose synthase/poly-beta-1,6-N-acetylglucosamine synthase-like glycosyltransferase